MNAFENINSYVQNFDPTMYGGGTDDQVSFGLLPNAKTVLVGLTSHMGQRYAEDGKTLVPSGRYRIAYLFLQQLQGQWCPIVIDFTDMYGRRIVVDTEGNQTTFAPDDLESESGVRDDLYAATRSCPGRRDLAAKAFASLYQQGAKTVTKELEGACEQLKSAGAVFSVAGVYVDVLQHKETLHCISKKGKKFDFCPYLVRRTSK